MALDSGSNPPDVSRRSFLKTAAAAAAAASLPGEAGAQTAVGSAQSAGGAAPLMAYVGTFSSPLRDVLPTQVDLPPGNGRGIHIFEVNRATGALAPRGDFRLWARARVASRSTGPRRASTRRTRPTGLARASPAR